MRYVINRENFRKFEIREIGKLPPRSYFIPYGSRDDLESQDVLTERYNSDMVQVLNGEWDFKYFEKDMLIPNEFYTDRVQFDTVPVPSVWTRTGYREPCYLNTRYEFDPTLYPEMPQDTPMGIYRKCFNIDDTKKKHIITFLGVMSSLDLYVNGKFVGYSEGSHNSAEFDISEFVTEGENELLAVVSKWSTGTYLECQDMFRENGIFRDVYITKLDSTYVYDFFADSKRNEDGTYNLTVSVDVNGTVKGYTLECEVLDASKKSLVKDEKAAKDKTEFSFKNLDVKEWNAEEPYVYTLYVTLRKGKDKLSVSRNTIGFKTVEIKKNIFLFNSKAIKFKGVNHHDTNPKTGYVLKGEEIESELKIMKKFNINAIRTSHYPPDPVLLTLADILGFYIVDEADIETHGAFHCKKPGTPNLISNDLKWAPRYIDRVSRMYYRDRNHPSITMWSLGNEAGGYKCQDECYNFLKEQGTPIPVHYEGVIKTRRLAYDVISEMYPWQSHVEKVGNRSDKNRFNQKPFFMCEYCHAMGVGPGGLEEYWQSIYAHDNLMGGCIWEWADHAVYHDENDPKYRFKYTYGGDHGEEKHDSNFCVDGMMYPDRSPHTGAYVIKAVYRPVRSRYIGNFKFEFTNTNRFRNASYLKVVWTKLINGKETESGEIKLDIEPTSTKIYEIPFGNYGPNDDCHINIAYFDGDTRLAMEQAVISDRLRFSARETAVGKVDVFTEGDIVKIAFDNGNVCFDKSTGEMVSYVRNQCEYINRNPVESIKGFVPNLTRAKLDNDSYGYPPKQWDIIKLDSAVRTLKSFDVSSRSGYAVVNVVYTIKKAFKKYFDVTVRYTVYGNGLVEVDSILNSALMGSNEIQRFGLMIELPAQFSDVEFYGRGSDEKMENLCDLNDHARIGIYKMKVSEMHEPYIMPQDNFNCGGVKQLKLSNSKGNTLCFYGEPKFSFSAHDYTQKALDAAKHQEELIHSLTTVVCIDGFMRGTGTHTCGPDTLAKYRVKTNSPLRFRFSFRGE